MLDYGDGKPEFNNWSIKTRFVGYAVSSACSTLVLHIATQSSETRASCRADQSGQIYVAREWGMVKCAEFCTVRTKLFREVRLGACAVSSTNVQSYIQEDLKILLLWCEF